MATLVQTGDLTPITISRMATSSVNQIYNALDCCLTFEIAEVLQSLCNEDPLIYRFERALQAPVLEMMQRGFKIDPLERSTAAAEERATIATLDTILQRYAMAVWDKPLNPRSTQQLQAFFYGRMRLPEQWTANKGKRTLSMNRESLEKLNNYFLAMPIVACILAIRDHAKRLQLFETEIDADGRYRTSFNIAGTETGRFSSSKSQTGTGGNAQNISPGQRRIFEADPGYRLYGIDLEQAESREVGWKCGLLFGEWAYYDAALAGDLHTTAAKLVWPKLPWTGDGKKDKDIAEQPFYRHFTYRDMAKRGGHGCLTAEHEVLTSEGWVSITTKPNRIMTFHPESGSRFEQVTNWLDFAYTGKMVEVNNQAISFKATANHRILGTTSEYGTGYKVYTAENMPKSIKIPKGWGYTSDVESENNPAMAQFLAAFHADGHQKTTNRCEFHLHKQRKVDRLRLLCKQLGLTLDEDWANCKYMVHITLPSVKKDTWPGFHWAKNDLLAYLREYPKWDGHASETALCIFSASLEFLELFQTFGRLLGYGGNISKARISGFGSKMWSLQINNRKFACVTAPIHTQETTQVYCPTVESSFFYIRRNGKISVTGNSNYFGQPFSMARFLHVPKKVMEDFQRAYFDAFPGIPKWHRWVAGEIQTNMRLTTNFGRTRYFFGRTNDDSTLREAIAFEPQSCTADRTNLVLWRIWKHMPQVQLLTQEHDAIYFQAREELDPELVSAEAFTHFEIDFSHPSGRRLIVPGECKVGWNKASYVGLEEQARAARAGKPIPRLNLNGLRKLKGPDSRIRETGLHRTL